MSGRVLVTGASGFVGGHLVEQLGAWAAPCEADVGDRDALAAVLSRERPDAVVHLAAASSVAESWRASDVVWRVNVLGTVNLLDAVAATCPSARVLVVSSGEVYGDTGEAPAGELAPLDLISPYAASKAAAELACARARRADGLDVVVARAFPHIGPGQDERFAVGSWVRQVAELEASGGGTLAVGALDVRRDFTDVRDVCRAYVALLDRGVPAEIYNVASGRAVPLQLVVDGLVALARCTVEVVVHPGRLRPLDIRVLCGDAMRLERATGWTPQIPLERSLEDALAAARAATAASPS